jgi:transposase-like protein
MSKVNRNTPKRSTASDSLYALFEFERDFPDDAACLEHLVRQRYPQGIFCTNPKCPHAGEVTKHHREKKRPSYSCQFCGHRVHPMAGTIFADSATSLRLWYYAIYLMTSTRCGISAKQLERELGVTYKTAWRMFNKVRSLMGQDGERWGGTVEMDEAYIGPKGSRAGRPREGAQKSAVFGIAQRKDAQQRGRIMARVVPSVQATTIVPIIWEKVLPESVVYTDEYGTYNLLGAFGYRHSRIHHSQRVYVMGDVHTNTVEGFWAMVKNGISGVHHGVSAKWLQSYLDEYAYRYNSRGREMFRALLSRVAQTQAAS